MTTSILWLRRDLRINDHPALQAARSADRMIPVFCFDDALLTGRHASGARTQFLLECLAGLDGALRDRGSRLFVRHGSPPREIARLARQAGAESVHVSADVSPFARRRDVAVRRALGEHGVEFVAHPGMFALDALEPVRTGQGKPYTVFTPFYKSWLGRARRETIGAPRTLPATGRKAAGGSLPTLESLGLEQEVSDPAPGGEPAARTALTRFLGGPVDDYADEHDTLTGRAVSRLSPYLHFGCISPREIEERLGNSEGAQAFRRQLCWRDFYAHVLGHYPQNAAHEFQARYRGTLNWSHAEKRFEAWCEGQTGYPVVDAGMRQLRREGWLHNRARLIVGSFLTKDLGIDWRWGERWFMRMLIDGDEASNNGNWQWIASVGVDPAPAFQRVFNPTRQLHRFDPDGVYVREYVPELRRVPDEYLAEPWTMDEATQERCGCRIGADYPEPIVDHAEARREALDRYRV
ncbi:MAG TPA: deoxyribodipyrimidine photo-lyase [Solirubrobacteraceae bacterium]